MAPHTFSVLILVAIVKVVQQRLIKHLLLLLCMKVGRTPRMGGGRSGGSVLHRRLVGLVPALPGNHHHHRVLLIGHVRGRRGCLAKGRSVAGRSVKLTWK